MIGYMQLLKDIEGLKGKRLKSIKSGADLVVDDVDYDNKNVTVHVADDPTRRNSRSFREFEAIRKRMADACLTDNPWVSVDEALGGSGSSRNQPETIVANLPYVVWSRPNNRKCIAYVGRSVHAPAENKEADDSDLRALREMREEEYSSSLSSKFRNWIFFGAPGTGKSYQLKKLAEDSFIKENISRVTFYPDYTYSQFVGSFKPVTRYQYVPNDHKSDMERSFGPTEDESCAPQTEAGEHMEAYISYEFVPGPFLDVYIKAVQNPNENYLLVVEEINRANPAAVFGDVFQLLDRDSNGRSEYEVAVPRDMRSYFETFLPEYATTAHISNPEKLLSERNRLTRETARLSLPPNMYIWATMNSADQGVYPMDTAFKRRWDFRYIGIDDGEDAEVSIADEKRRLSDVSVSWGKEGTHKANWNTLRKAINGFLSNDVKLNEDKLLGPFFVTPSSLTDERFGAAFKDKVLLYLYEDACKTKHSKVFAGDLNTYSAVCEAFDERGTGIFVDGFKSHYKEGASVASEDNASPEE